MKKTSFLTLEKAKQIIEQIPTPFHIYDEAGIRRNAQALKAAFAWNPGFREYFAVKATPNPYILKLLGEEGCGCDCSSYTELLLAEAVGAVGKDIMFSSNVTPEKDMRKAVELAVQYDKLIDLHCDETDDDQSRFLELLTALVIMEDIGERTTASHTCSFGSVNNAYAFRMMANFKRAGINFISCPTENIYLQGRQDSYPKRRGLTRVKEFFEAGINVCFAQDSISDPWYPLGNGNMMNILDHGIHICQMMSFEEIDRAFELVTVNGARTMHLMDEYGIFAGRPASFLVLEAESVFEAIRNRVGVLRSVRKGEELFVREPVKISVCRSGYSLLRAYTDDVV